MALMDMGLEPTMFLCNVRNARGRESLVQAFRAALYLE